MKQGFAIWLVLGALFALWLYNTGRVAAFKAFIVNTPGRSTLPGQQLGAVGTAGAAAQNSVQLAACAAEADAGVVSGDCANTFLAAASDPIGTVSAGISQLTFGLVKL
jgi:hypothetical protein